MISLDQETKMDDRSNSMVYIGSFLKWFKN